MNKEIVSLILPAWDVEDYVSGIHLPLCCIEYAVAEEHLPIGTAEDERFAL